MISLIVCSRQPDISTLFRSNVFQTIGNNFAYEWIIINNSKNQYNIFQAYNEGVRKSSGDILCFMHDDIMFHSKNWGDRVHEHFNTYPYLGCLGVAGGHLMLDTPSSFWHSQARCMHYYGRDEAENMILVDDTKFRNPSGLTQVASVDGLWMCIRRSLFETIRFDDISYKGFHCYDSDICMQIIKAGYDIGIAFDILIEHSKKGSQNANYFESIEIWHRKWHDFLPISRGVQLSKEEIDTRTAFVQQIISLEKQVCELEQVYHSKKYRIGEFLTKPFRALKK